jgi:hypothetical protein
MLLVVSCLGVDQGSQIGIASKTMATLIAEEVPLQSEMVDML